MINDKWPGVACPGICHWSFVICHFRANCRSIPLQGLCSCSRGKGVKVNAPRLLALPPSAPWLIADGSSRGVGLRRRLGGRRTRQVSSLGVAWQRSPRGCPTPNAGGPGGLREITHSPFSGLLHRAISVPSRKWDAPGPFMFLPRWRLFDSKRCAAGRVGEINSRTERSLFLQCCRLRARLLRRGHSMLPRVPARAADREPGTGY